MRLVVKTIHVHGAVHGLSAGLDEGHLLIQNDQSLVSVSRLALLGAPVGVKAAIAPQPAAPHTTGTLSGYDGSGRVLATGVAVDNAWVVAPKMQRVLLVRAGEFQSLDPVGKQEAPPTKVAGLPRGTFGMALSADERRALLVATRNVNPDFSEYAVIQVDLATGNLVREPSIGSTAELAVLWDAAQGAWVVGNTSTGALWRWDADKPAAELAGPADVSVQSATFAATEEGITVTALATQGTGAIMLLAGRAGTDRIAWAAPVPLPGGTVTLARRHGSRPLWACLADERARQAIQLHDASGKLLATTPLPPAMHFSNLLWSGASSNRLWGWDFHVFGEINLVET